MVDRLRQHLDANPVCHDVVDRPFYPEPPCTLEAMVAAERELGFALPVVLRDIYLEIANGGFGPGYGVMGIRGGFTDDGGHTVEDAYRMYLEPDPEDPTWVWPQGWLPICHWGCNIYSAVNCVSAPNPVYFADLGTKEPGEPMETILHRHKDSLSDWLNHWMNGKNLWTEVWG